MHVGNTALSVLLIILAKKRGNIKIIRQIGGDKITLIRKGGKQQIVKISNNGCDIHRRAQEDIKILCTECELFLLSILLIM